MFWVEVGCPRAVALVGLGDIDRSRILAFVFVHHGIARVIRALADQPAEDLLRIRGFAMRDSAVLPYQVVMFSFDTERQHTAAGSETHVQRSIRANRPSTRGR